MATSKKKTPSGNKTDKADKARKDSDVKSKAAAIEHEAKAKASKPSKVSPAHVSKSKPVKEPSPEPKSAKAVKQPAKAKEAVKPLPETPKGKPAKKGKAAEDGKEVISPAALKAITAVKASSGAKGKQAPKKATVAVYTMDDVREVLKNRSDEARELAEKKEAAAKKAAVSTIIPDAPQQTRVLGAATLADILGFGTHQPAKVEEPVSTYKRDVPAKFRKYFEMLTSLREKIQGKINQRGRVANKSDADAELAVPAQTDDDDTFDHDFALSLVANEQDALSEIDAALERIYDGTYGICEITGKEISHERLDAVPFARFSVEGQAQFEMQNRRRAQRMTSFMDSSEDSAAFSGEEPDE
jgi:RNA polymerase-binding transcription factor DksA